MFDEMINDYKTLAELQEFAESQFKTIVTQKKKMQEMETEIVHLKKLLEHTAPVLELDSVFTLNDEETISRTQLQKLRDVSLSRELTLEEARKLEIYSKIINSLETRTKKQVLQSKKLSTDDLVRQLEAPHDESNQG